MKNWQTINGAPEDKVIWTKIQDDYGFTQNIQQLIKQGNLWFVPDKSMYVYYTPTHWSY